MFRQALISLVTVASLGAIASVPASAQTTWNQNNTPCQAPLTQYSDGQNTYVVPTNYVAPTNDDAPADDYVAPTDYPVTQYVSPTVYVAPTVLYDYRGGYRRGYDHGRGYYRPAPVAVHMAPAHVAVHMAPARVSFHHH